MGTKIPDRIRREVEAEFPDDYALQQIHIARRLLAQQAKRWGGLAKLLEKRREQRTSSSDQTSAPKPVRGRQ